MDGPTGAAGGPVRDAFGGSGNDEIVGFHGYLDNDRKMDLSDRLRMAAEWVRCTEPFDPGCLKPN